MGLREHMGSVSSCGKALLRGGRRRADVDGSWGMSQLALTSQHPGQSTGRTQKVNALKNQQRGKKGVRVKLSMLMSS
mgnify:CR=1 FL=1|jgi:hypothetical protein